MAKCTMSVFGWTFWCLLLSAPLSLCSLDIVDADSGVTCSQGLRCSMTNGSPLAVTSVKVTDLRPQVKLCCRSRPTCTLCLLIQVEVDLDEPGDDEDEEEGSNSGQSDDVDTEETKQDKAKTDSVTVCYKTPETAVDSCKEVKVTVDQARPPQQSTVNISMVISNAKISYGSLVLFHLPNVPDIFKQLHVPLLQVCKSEIRRHVRECNMPKLKISLVKGAHVELQYPDDSSSVPVVCLQNEMDGICKPWDRNPIPLESLTPCTCFQVWTENKRLVVHSRICPFGNNTSLLKHVTVSVDQMRVDNLTVLRWTVSAPCRLRGEVWPCERSPGPPACSQIHGSRREHLGDRDSWFQDRTGLWKKVGAFEKLNMENSPCVMIKIGKWERGPFCYNNINRWRWSVFVVALIFLLTLTLLITVGLRDFIKKSVRRWRHCGFHKTVQQAHILVLSPPDSDEEVSAEVSKLGSLLWSEPRLPRVNVDQWRRKDQFSRGPLPWSHGQLLDMNSPCERVVLVLTPKAVERAQAWSRQDNSVVWLQEDSPYSDVFLASLFAIQAYKKQDRASDCFVLVTFECLWTDTKTVQNDLPEILQGLPLFHFPSQIKALLSELCVKRTPPRQSRTDGPLL